MRPLLHRRCTHPVRCLLRSLQDAKKHAAGPGGSVLSAADGLVLLEHCLEGSGKGVRAAVVWRAKGPWCFAGRLAGWLATARRVCLRCAPWPQPSSPPPPPPLYRTGLRHAPPLPPPSAAQDLRDALLGRVFGLGALVRAGLVRTAASASLVASALLGLAHKRSFLREAAVCVVLEMLLGGPGGAWAGAGPGGDEGAAAAANGGAHEGGGQKGKKKDKKGKGAGGGEGGEATWLDRAAVAQLLGEGPGGCEALRRLLAVGAREASPEVTARCGLLRAACCGLLRAEA